MSRPEVPTARRVDRGVQVQLAPGRTCSFRVTRPDPERRWLVCYLVTSRLGDQVWFVAGDLRTERGAQLTRTRILNRTHDWGRTIVDTSRLVDVAVVEVTGWC